MTFPQRLIDGYSAFAAGRLLQEQDYYRALAERGQSPKIMVIGCCDSRVSLEVIFDARPGELFVVRNVGNLVPPYTPDGAQRAVSAALEFAVQELRIKHIVILGHAQCGCMPLADYLTQLEQASVVQMLDNLMTFPCVSILVERNKLVLHAAYFSVATGELSVLDRASGKFLCIGTGQHAG